MLAPPLHAELARKQKYEKQNNVLYMQSARVQLLKDRLDPIMAAADERAKHTKKNTSRARRHKKGLSRSTLAQLAIRALDAS